VNATLDTRQLAEENRDGARKRAVATPIGTALSRHDALPVPLGSASLQRSPPPAFLIGHVISVDDTK